MSIVEGDRSLEGWRAATRELLAARVHWSEVEWIDPDQGQAPLAAARECGESAGDRLNGTSAASRVPGSFLTMARHVLCHTDVERWAVLYRVLWRLTVGGEARLMSDAADEDVRRLGLWEKAVRRDVHKMKAFVRFRRVVEGAEEGTGSREHFVAWHRPDYHVLDLAGEFFARRFGVMTWSILTPRGSLHWDGEALVKGSAVGRHEAPNSDAMEDLWRTYYASVFNPARLNERAMKREMPVRHWGTLPEASLIEDLVRAAGGRVGEMMAMPQKLKQTAADFIPVERTLTLPVLRAAVQECRGCELYMEATQAVFGEGPAEAALMLVGEQPGDQEDLAGRPFIGPAGQLLDRALAEAGIVRSEVYVTNAVKHFKWAPSPSGQRIGQKPTVGEIHACRPWLEREIALVKPRVILVLGATAAQSLMGAGFRVTKERGRIIEGTERAAALIASFHPSAILRAPDQDRKAEQYAMLVKDLRLAKDEAGM